MWHNFQSIVLYHAARLCRVTRISYDDLYQSGMLGLFEAMERLNESMVLPQQVKFVERYVWHYILKTIRELQHPVYIPLHLNKRVNSGEVKFSSVSDEVLEYTPSDEDNSGKATHSKSTVGCGCFQTDNGEVDGIHYCLIIRRSLSYLVESRLVDGTEVVCFIIFHGLFDYPRYPIEQIAKIVGISANTASKKVLKVRKCLKDAIPQLFNKETVFVQ